MQKSYEQIEKLMDEIIRQQNERRKSELDALQSQINPHFLYNTLESITWMVEAQENEGAVRMISELAKLLRVSLSRERPLSLSRRAAAQQKLHEYPAGTVQRTI